ncbi:hypothetical protein SLA2020_455760 [Shorea laevis]
MDLGGHGSRCCERNYGGKQEVDITVVESICLSRVWMDILSIGWRLDRLREMLVEGFRWEVGDGKRVSFWRENWVGSKLLRDVCPRLFELVVNKDGKIQEIGGWEGGRWRWK